MPDDRPNVLIIYPDQMRYDTLACTGNPCVRTPHMDRLAGAGVRFDHAYTSFPLCCPFRASVMTGKYAHSNGMYANHYPMPLDHAFLAEQFRDAGYATGYVGKWHLDGGVKHGYVPPERRLGFDWFVGFNRGHQYFDSVFYRQNDPRVRMSRRYEGWYQTDHLIEFMTESCDAGKPFFGMICYGHPHPPLVQPPEYEAMYAPDAVPVRENTPEAKRDKAREFLAKYYGAVTCVDDCVGRALDWLESQGQADNTIVWLVSDHGEMAGEHGLYGKKVSYEASMRVPMIVRWPNGIAGGRVAADLMDPAVDTMPTLLDLCGLRIPDGVQGLSFADMLTDATCGPRNAVFYEILKETDGPERFPVPERGVRTRDWLYVRRETDATHLFELATDALDTDNRIHDEALADCRRRLDDRLSQHMQETDDRWDIEAHFPPPDFQTHEEGAAHYRSLVAQAILEE